MSENQPTRVCTKCGEGKPLCEFYIRSGRSLSQCRKCERAAQRSYYKRYSQDIARRVTEWRAKNPESVKAIKARYEERHKEEKRARNKHWEAVNPEKANALKAAWRAANPGYSKEWASRNRDKVNSYAHNRRAKYIGRYTKADIEAIFARQRGLCANPACRVSIASKFDVDHIMPIHRGGTNWPDNIQLLCRKCNRCKDVKDPYEWAQENGKLFI